MDTKSLRVEVKDADKGQVTAVFSSLNAIDSDQDVTLEGAFTDGAEVVISAYGHQSWEGRLPVGKGTIRTTKSEAVLDGQFFLDTAHGADTFKTVQRLGELGQWSYGFDVLKESYGDFDGRRVRFLEQVQVHEVSPVLLGAGVNTRTLTAKSATAVASGSTRPVPRHETPVVARSWDGAATVKALADDIRPSELRSVFAHVDAAADPEGPKSYRLPHHHGAGGPANLRACLAGIADLNSPRSAGLSEAERKNAYEHLASHVRDADREPPALRKSGGPTRFTDELLEGLAGTSALIDSASRVVALRAEKGKSLSKVNTEVLDWIADDLKRLNALLTTPPAGVVSDEELASVVVAGLARLRNLGAEQ